MQSTHTAIIACSGRPVPVIRLGRLLMVLHGRAHGEAAWSVSTCRYDKCFLLLAKGKRTFPTESTGGPK